MKRVFPNGIKTSNQPSKMTVMKQFDIHFYTLSLLFLAYSGGAGAQNDSPDEGLSVAGTELLKDQKLWSKSGNAAGTAFDNTRNYSRLHINYESATGRSEEHTSELQS